MSPAPVQVPSQRLHALSVMSVTSAANDKGDNEMIPGAVHRCLDICLTAEENPRIPQLGDCLMKRDVRPVITSNGAPFLQMRSVGLHSMSGRELAGKDGTGSILDDTRYINIFIFFYSIYLCCVR